MQIKLASIILFALDVKRLKTFYVDTFKLTILEEIKDEWIVLNAGGCNIGLHKIGKEYIPADGKKQQNNTKIVFQTDAIKDLREKSILKGVEIGEIKTFENFGYWVCDGKDPEGNVFQLSQKK